MRRRVRAVRSLSGRAVLCNRTESYFLPIYTIDMAVVVDFAAWDSMMVQRTLM